MVRLVVVAAGMLAAAGGCAQRREGVLPPGMPAAAMTDDLSPIQQQVNGDLIVASGKTPRVDRPVATAGFRPGVNGDGPIAPPRPAIRQPEPVPVAAPPELEPVPETAVASVEPEAPAPAEQELPIGRPEDDPEVSRASYWPDTEPIVGEWIARVDDDVITVHEFLSDVKRRIQGVDQAHVTPEQRGRLNVAVLDHLIDRSLVIQEARRKGLKDEKRWEMITKGGVELWEKQRLPLLLKQYGAEDRYELEQRMAERGFSLDEEIETFKLDFIYHQFLLSKVSTRLNVDLPEMRAYYLAHRDDAIFQQDSQYTWREIVVRRTGTADPAAVRVDKAEQALARIHRGEDFAAVARALSDGPNAADGGLWKTAPGGYGVAAVNEALERLRPGEVSGIVEGPSSHHIVKLESYRPAGRMSFAEVQTLIREALEQQKRERLFEDLLLELYDDAIVTTIIDDYIPRNRREPD